MYLYLPSAVFQAVLHKVPEYGVNQTRIPVHAQAVLQGILHQNTHFLQPRPKFVRHLVHDILQIHFLLMQLFRSLLYLGYHPYVADQVGQSHHLHVCPLQEHIPLLCGNIPAHCKRLQISADTADRCPEFMGYIVGHLLFYHLVLLYAGNIVYGHFETVVRVNQHLKGIYAPALVHIVLEHRDIVYPGIGIARNKLGNRLEYLAVPQGIEVRSRPVQHQVHELHEPGIGINLFLFLRENGDAAVVIVQVQQKPFLLESNNPVALLQSVIALQHLFSDIAQFGIRERHVLVIHLPLVRSLSESVQP